MVFVFEIQNFDSVNRTFLSNMMKIHEFHEEYLKSFLCHWNEYLIRFDNNFGADWSIEIEFTRSLLKKIQDLFFRRVFNGRKCHPPKNLFLGIISIFSNFLNFSVFPFSPNSIPNFRIFGDGTTKKQSKSAKNLDSFSSLQIMDQPSFQNCKLLSVLSFWNLGTRDSRAPRVDSADGYWSGMLKTLFILSEFLLAQR